ncbi:prepilin peptidase [Candidatus Burkholderia verschuerenii]|uniref:prepilin peptidase n=1 Tax=Candidatus Burkholderia verschuerenii TaxID=242163 RepID=UPI0009F99B01|nr:A24 family peptidase [Candidatus Burkholderia verschuerenii]
MQHMMVEFAAVPMAIRSGLVALVGLVIGSFLTVVIHRLPIMLVREWAGQDQQVEAEASGRYNLLVPRSGCPVCGHQLRAWENVPVLSYLFLRGRCSQCRAAIHWRYPLIEMLSAMLAVFVMLRFGVCGKALAGYLFAASLLTLACIDAETGLLPDAITLPMIAAGLVINFAGVFTTFRAAVIGAVAGYAMLAAVLYAARALGGRDGLGFGDLKLFAAIGAWFGVASVSQVFLVSFVLAAAHGASLVVRGKASSDDAMPFGPFIALAGVFTLFAGLPLAL